MAPMTLGCGLNRTTPIGQVRPRVSRHTCVRQITASAQKQSESPSIAKQAVAMGMALGLTFIQPNLVQAKTLLASASYEALQRSAIIADSLPLPSGGGTGGSEGPIFAGGAVLAIIAAGLAANKSVGGGQSFSDKKNQGRQEIRNSPSRALQQQPKGGGKKLTQDFGKWK